MRIFYNCLLYLILPLIPIRLLWRSRKNPKYRQRIGERFGYFHCPYVNKKIIWVHAVSLGETIAAIPLIKALQQCYPEKLIVVTNTTPTGSAQTQRALGDSVFHVYAPYDYPGAVKRFLKHIQPELAIIMETELWPNLLYYAYQSNIPILLANARLSKRSAIGYGKIKSLVKPMLHCITHIAAQSNIDAERFISLGIPKEKVSVAGNIKFDVNLPAELIAQGKALRAQWGGRPVWIAASTHTGEEEIILSAYADLLKKMPNCLLILVPRHPERFAEVAQLCDVYKLNYVKRSSYMPVTDNTNIFLGDTMGEMFLFYSAADVAFVGGSFVTTGGHNLLEPAALGIPTITGPNLFNFTAIADLMNAVRANKVVNNRQALVDAIFYLLQNKTALQAAGAAGKRIVAENQGALQRYVALVAQILLKNTRC